MGPLNDAESGGKEEERNLLKKKLTADDFSEDVATTLYPVILAS